MPQRKSFASLAVILALAAAPVFAAEDPHHPGGAPPAGAATPQGMGQGMPASGMGGMMGGMPMMGMMRGMMEGGMGGMPMMAGHADGRIAFLKAELKITDAQLPLWNAVAEAIRANAKSGMGMMDGMGMAQGGKVPDRLAAREKMMAEQVDALRKFKSAVEPLYTALSEEQKKTADQILISPMGMM
jgi:hypothetical protein